MTHDGRCVRRLRSAGSSRDATNELLTGLRTGRWRPRAWLRFLGRAAQRSVAQGVARPCAVAQVTALHAALLALGGGRRWTLTSWVLAVTHLGLLESRRCLGPADLVTLVRANLPVSALASRPSVATVALCSDILDGRLARRRGTSTPFGRDADTFADAVFWTWFAMRHEPVPVLRALAMLSCAAPVAVVAGVSIARGEMPDVPRPDLARPAAALQILLTVRAVSRSVSRAFGLRAGSVGGHRSCRT